MFVFVVATVDVLFVFDLSKYLMLMLMLIMLPISLNIFVWPSDEIAFVVDLSVAVFC